MIIYRRGVDRDRGDLVDAHRRGVPEHVRLVFAHGDHRNRGVHAAVAQAKRGFDRLLIVGVHQPRDRGLRQRLAVLADREPPSDGVAVDGIGIEHLFGAANDSQG